MATKKELVRKKKATERKYTITQDSCQEKWENKFN